MSLTQILRFCVIYYIGFLGCELAGLDWHYLREGNPGLFGELTLEAQCYNITLVSDNDTIGGVV